MGEQDAYHEETVQGDGTKARSNHRHRGSLPCLLILVSLPLVAHEIDDAECEWPEYNHVALTLVKRLAQ